MRLECLSKCVGVKRGDDDCSESPKLYNARVYYTHTRHKRARFKPRAQETKTPRLLRSSGEHVSWWGHQRELTYWVDSYDTHTCAPLSSSFLSFRFVPHFFSSPPPPPLFAVVLFILCLPSFPFLRFPIFFPFSSFVFNLESRERERER